MTDGRWTAILQTQVDPNDNWITLPENGWGALVAYAAGPGRARPHDVPLERRTVSHTIERHGAAAERIAPMTLEEQAIIKESVTEYLTELGYPPAPRTWWEAALPDGMTGDQLMEVLSEAVERIDGPHSGIEYARREAQAILDEVQKIYAGG